MKIAHTRGEWSVMKREVPQGSLTGPLLFNICINDYILSLDKICSVYNYADDNTLCCANRDPLLVKSTLECAAKCSLNWFKDNFMKANPAKFQAMLLGRDFKQMTINVEGNTIEMISSVKLLGIHIDNKLSFNEHISKLCKKSANQINVMKRLARHLDYDCRLKVYDCFFLSNFNYYPLAYNSQYVVNDNKIEKLNKRMLRVVCNDRISSYSDLLSRVNRPTMYVNRNKLLAEQVFKIIHDLSPPILPDFYTKQDTVYNLRDNNMIVQPPFSTIAYGFKSIASRARSYGTHCPGKLKRVLMSNTSRRHWPDGCLKHVDAAAVYNVESISNLFYMLS